MKRLPLANGREHQEPADIPSGAGERADSIAAQPGLFGRGSGWQSAAARWRGLSWIVLAALLLLPVAVYWDTIFHYYGFRDDYAVLRESHEEPGKVARVGAMQGRPLAGVLMELSFAQLDGIHDLQWLRLVSALLLGGMAVVMYRQLRAAKWDRFMALLLGALIITLPGSQLLVGWTVGGPMALAVLLALAAFSCAERAFAEAGKRRAWWWSAAVGLVVAGALTDRANTLFYVVPLAAALWPRRRWAGRTVSEWFVRHLVTLGLGLGVAFTLMTLAYAYGWVALPSHAGAPQTWPGKLGWFVLEPLQNAFALIALDEDDGSRLTHRVAALVALLVLGGVVQQGQTRGWRHALRWLAALVALLVVSFSVNLFGSERWAGYRLLLPMTGVVCVFAAIALVSLGGRRIARLGLAALVVPGAWLARRQAFELIAWPQGLELALIENGARQIAPDRTAKVFVITPTVFDRTTGWTFLDEFGALSTDSDWAPKEMLKLVLAEQQGGLDELDRVSAAYTVDCGRKLPEREPFDCVIDLRRLRMFRGVEPEAGRRQFALAARPYSPGGD